MKEKILIADANMLTQYDWGRNRNLTSKGIANDMLLHLIYPKTVSC